MLNIKLWLADLLGVVTPQLIPACVLQARQQPTINPPFAPDYAPNACVTDPGTAGEIVHGINLTCLLQHFQHVLDISGHLDSASQHGVMDFDLAKSRPFITPREIAGASGMGASGHAHQSKAVR